ncbi:unnamed protein product [Toxocara canis]|uniref:Uncharacterized protein n=1 Tax=Toxocara canis TaxID=6265 RepID=A0A183UN58_TOXCA|nr:unnamed protein product [Toxocara canis]
MGAFHENGCSIDSENRKFAGVRAGTGNERSRIPVWKGNEVDARILEGTLVHLKLTCAEDAKTTFCLVFRIAGIHVNSKWTSGSGEELQWRHVELIACILLAILLAITVFASISLWAVCWPIKKGKLISRMQLHFLYHIKQQQQYMQEQIAAVKVSCSQHPTSALDGQHFSPCAAIQKRKLYFSADFFEPEMLANPPQMAQQFVVELRKMIEIAKDRARLKRHIPTLATITEEHENAEYLEISSPSCGAVQRVDEPSPKSVKSSDSGCDSMSDDDTQTQSTSEHSENCVCASADRPSTSRTPIMAPTAKNSCPNAAAAVIPSRISTMASSRMVSPMTPSPRLPPKSAVFNGIRMSNGLAGGAIVPTSCAPPNEPPPPPPALRNPPSLERVLNSVPPPPPDSEPPDPSSMQAFQVNCPTRTAYAVFPNESMRKKSLPRRSKKASQKGVPPPPVETSM